MISVFLLTALCAIALSPAHAQWDVRVGATTLGNSPGKPCQFPFTYNGLQYNECITSDNGFIPWCSTTASYDSQKQWTRCNLSIRANRTRNGNAPKSSCTFPFIYKGQQYNECISIDHEPNKPWCSTSENFPRDKKWAECYRVADIKTTGGNVPENSTCNIPFTYQGNRIHGCITTNNKGVGWCSTTDNYDQDKQWGNCKVTTIKESDDNCPNGNTYTKAANTLSYGGKGRPAGNSVAACQKACDEDSKCIGFDFDSNPGLSTKCYIHDVKAVFDAKERQGISLVDQYTLTNRCTSSSGNAQPVEGGPVLTRGGNAGPTSRCSFPYWYDGYQYTSCNSKRWPTPWCATTNNYNRDQIWGECSNIPTS